MKYFITALIFIISNSCIHEVEYNVDQVPRKLVVNSVIEANHLIEVNLSALGSIFDSSYQFINDAVVCLSTGILLIHCLTKVMENICQIV